MKRSVKVKKFSGDIVDYDEGKLIASLKSAKADHDLARQIVEEVRNSLYDGISTKEIYQKAFRLLKSRQRPSAARYKIKRAIMELGPSGFPFERYIGHILKSEGYDTEVGIVMQGNCIDHEVDVLANKENRCHIIECKYHNMQGKPNDVKIPLYIHSRFIDIRRNLENSKGDQLQYKGGIFTNTRFTNDAITYAKCVGLELVSWNYPQKKSLKYRINKSKLFPITSLTSISKREKIQFLEWGVVLCKEIYENPAFLKKMGISDQRIKKVLADITDLCENDSNEIGS